ncbi:MAG: hypothetical protein PHW92_01515 [Lutibacter sp.]|nr:hypothetical protein [Lutibacter sp.]
MRILELNQLQTIQGGSTQGAICGISIGLMFYPPTFFAGALGFALSCMTSDS